MPSAGEYTDFKAQLATDVQAGWPAVKAVHFGWPHKVDQDLDYAVVILNNVTSDLGGPAASVNAAHQEYEFDIVYVGRVPAPNVNLIDWKVEKANALAVILETNELYASAGMLPCVTKIELGERWEFEEGVTLTTVTLTFRCVVKRAWGT